MMFKSSAWVGEANLGNSQKKEENIHDVFDWQFTPHPKYKGSGAYYDMAVIFLEKNLEYNENIQPVCVPLMEDLSRDAYEGQMVNLLGK